MPNSGSVWPTHDALHERYELMDRMMETRGLDVLTALRMEGGLAFIEARARCRYCMHEELCWHWLANDGQRGPADFCPNAAFFKSCKDAES